MGRVLGLGAAKEGAEHWWRQRVTSVALVLLTLWFVVALLRLPTLDHAIVTAWIAQPVTAVLLALLTATSVYHSQLGVQVVIEDYVAHKGWKVVVMLAVTFVHVLLAALAIFAVLRIAFGAAA
jgi:succinate dehydrogenase / fumarate reductase membrane anchor subunit